MYKRQLPENYKIPKKAKIDSVVKSSLPGESKHRLNSVVVVPPPGEFRPRSSQYQPTRTWFSTKRYTRSYQATKYSGGSNSRKRQRCPQTESGSERQATEVVQMLTAALKKIHLTSVAVQTGKSTAEVATQTDLKDVSPQGSTPGKKSNRKCYKCNGNHLKKNCPFKQVVQPGQTLMQDEEMLSAEDILRDLNSQMTEDHRQEEKEIQEFQNQTWDLLQQQQIEELEVNFHVTCDDLNMYNSEDELVF